MTTRQPAQIPGHEPTLQERITRLAAAVRKDDPELCAWILRMQRAAKQRRSRAVRLVRLEGKGKAGKFYVPAEMVKEGE